MGKMQQVQQLLENQFQSGPLLRFSRKVRPVSCSAMLNEIRECVGNLALVKPQDKDSMRGSITSLWGECCSAEYWLSQIYDQYLQDVESSHVRAIKEFFRNVDRQIARRWSWTAYAWKFNCQTFFQEADKLRSLGWGVRPELFHGLAPNQPLSEVRELGLRIVEGNEVDVLPFLQDHLHDMESYFEALLDTVLPSDFLVSFAEVELIAEPVGAYQSSTDTSLSSAILDLCISPCAAETRLTAMTYPIGQDEKNISLLWCLTP